MQGGLDYIMLQYLNIDGIRTIGSVLGQSIALDYYGRQVCSSYGQDFLIYGIPYTSEIPLRLYTNISCTFMLGWWNGCRIYRHKPWDGSNWEIQNAKEETFPVGGQGKFKSCWCDSKAWTIWEVVILFVVTNCAA